MDSSILVIVPTFNERENIREFIADVLAQSVNVDVLVVDDESGDGTGDVVDNVAERDDRVSVIHRLGTRGRGFAVREGLGYAFRYGYDFAVEMDADGSHNPNEIGSLLDCIEGHDLVVGSRYVEGGRPIYDSWFRFSMSKLSNFFNRVILGMGYRDVTCDFRVYRLSSLEGFDLSSVLYGGFVFGVELLYRLDNLGFRVCEVPITFRERVSGKSKTDWRVVIKYPLEVIKMKRKVDLEE